MNGDYERLIKYLDAGWDQRHWYEDTRLMATKLLGPEFGDALVSMLAITSANTTVKGNVTLAFKAFTQWVQDEDFDGFMPAVKANLFAWKEGREINGPKIKEFEKALMGDVNAIVIDRWMLRAWGYKSNTAKNRQKIREDIRYLYALLDFAATPREIQAAIWFGIKKERDQDRDNRPYENHIMGRLSTLDKAWGEMTDEV